MHQNPNFKMTPSQNNIPLFFLQNISSLKAWLSLTTVGQGFQSFDRFVCDVAVEESPSL